MLPLVGGLLVAAALVFDVRTVFAHLQNGETGEFDATGFANVNWTMVIIISAAAIIAAVILFMIPGKAKDKE